MKINKSLSIICTCVGSFVLVVVFVIVVGLVQRQDDIPNIDEEKIVDKNDISDDENEIHEDKNSVDSNDDSNNKDSEIIDEDKKDEDNTNDSSNDNDNPNNNEDVIDKPLSNEALYNKLDVLMSTRRFNSYAIRLINSLIPDYQKLFTNEEIFTLISNFKEIRLNPYDPNNPNLSKTRRAYNAGDLIVINCYKGELDDDKNWDGLRWLLTHEIMHSLGGFSNPEVDKIIPNPSLKNILLEEGLADSIGHFVKGTDHDTKFAIINNDTFKMYNVNNKFVVDTNDFQNHTYTLYGSFINTFKYVGCYDEIIYANAYSNFNNLKQCMKTNVNNGEYYYNELLYYMNLFSLYVSYPNTFYTQEEAVNKSPEHSYMIKNTNLNKILINYSKLSADVINNKKDNTYSICEYKNNAAIFYSEDGVTFKNDLNC